MRPKRHSQHAGVDKYDEFEGRGEGVDATTGGTCAGAVSCKRLINFNADVHDFFYPLQHPHGTHVIQRALSVFHEPWIDLIFEPITQVSPNLKIHLSHLLLFKSSESRPRSS